MDLHQGEFGAKEFIRSDLDLNMEGRVNTVRLFQKYIGICGSKFLLIFSENLSSQTRPLMHNERRNKARSRAKAQLIE